MMKKPETSKDAADKLVKNIRRKTRQTYSAEEKIRIVLAGLRGEESISVLCRREGIAESLYYSWSKEFLEAGKRRELMRWMPPPAGIVYHDGSIFA
ncbi:transposase [Yoonia vestfoldensis SKA53]|uniref:Transposase n=1 Tax=Yoonia vestfoldensis SKA53 TaxID=314232 RepID=A3V1W6_9RHOB|nr:transposase [Yoonia vestfoldensis SKA53]